MMNTGFSEEAGGDRGDFVVRCVLLAYVLSGNFMNFFTVLKH